MQTFTSAMRLTFRYAFFCMAGCVILWALLPEYKVFLQSLFTGMFASTINGAVLVSKTMTIGKAAVEGKRPRGTGMLQRLIVAVFAVYLTVRFPDLFVLSGIIIGLFLIQLLSLLFVYRSLK